MRIYTLFIVSLICFLTSFDANGQLTANFTATTSTEGCSPLVVSFKSTTTGISSGSAVTYSWDLGNGATGTDSVASTTYNTAGTYTIKLTVTNAGTTSTKTITSYVTVYAVPDVNFSASPRNGCPRLCVNFTDASTPNASGTASYLWDFGDGTSATSQNPTHCFPTGYYKIALRVTNSKGCEASVEKDSFIHVYEPPTAGFSTSSTHYCTVPATVSFSNSSSGGISPLTYSWSFGSTSTSPTHIYSSPGVYDVQLIVTDSNNCKDTMLRTSYIYVGHSAASFTASKTSACIGDSISFTNNTTGTHTINRWDFGDGSTANTSNASHAYSTDGTYTVRLITSDGYCPDTVTKTITINPSPNPVITQSPKYPCEAPQTISFSSSGLTDYTWDYGDGSGTASGSSVSHTYSSNGVYIVSLTAKNGSGCKGTAYDTVGLYNLKTNLIAFPDNKGCKPLRIDFSENVTTDVPYAQLYPYPISSYHWDFGDGYTGTGAFPSHTYTDTGTFTVKLTVTSAGGCTATDTMIVKVGRPPIAYFYTLKDTVCAHQAIHFYDTSLYANGYAWDFDDNSPTDSNKEVTHSFFDTGTYHVTLTAIYNGCPDSMRRDIYVPPPVASLADTVDCASAGRLTVHFGDTGTVGATSYIWYFGDGSNATVHRPWHTYPSNGVYHVFLATYNNVSGCRDTAQANIHLRIPVASFVASDTNICLGDSIVFTGYLDTSIGTYWSFFSDSGYIAGNATVNVLGHRFWKTGCQDITMYVHDDEQCIDSAVRHNYVTVAKPHAAFYADPTIGCSPLTVDFIDTSKDVPCTSIYSRRWSFGNGDTALVTTSSTTYTYLSPEVDSVQLIVTDSIGCKDTLVKHNYVVSLKPSAHFLVSNELPCKFEDVIFNNYSTVDAAHDTLSSYVWDFGDGTTSTLTSPTHKYTDTGEYTVRLIAIDVHGCRDTMTEVNLIKITSPHAAFSMDDSVRICPPLFVNFTNHSTGATSYEWILGDGTAHLSLKDPSHLYNRSGYFPAMLIATDGHGCTDTAVAHVNIYGYAGGITYTPDSGCAPLLVNFKASITNAPTIVWDFSDGHTLSDSGNTTTSHLYTVPGAYVPKLILGDGKGCRSESIGLDTIKVDGVIAGYNPFPPCVDDTVHFIDTSKSYFSKVTTWLWKFYDGTSSMQQNPYKHFDSAGTYPVMLAVMNAHGCVDTLHNDVTIYPLPNINAGNDTVICVGDAATLDPTGGTSYVWSPDVDLSCDSCTNPQANPPTPTTYTVIGTDIHGCSNTDTVRVSLKTKATGMVDSAGAICKGLGEYLHAYGAHTYTWIPATGLDSDNIANPYATPEDTTTYMVIGKEGSCEPDTVYTTVVVYPKPTVDAGPDQTIIEGQPAQLQAKGLLVTTYLWSPTETLNCSDCSNPQARPIVTTIYTVTGISDYGCRDTDSVTVNVICDKSQVFIPNAFTPNGDGQNDVFYPRGVGIKIIKSFKIYNRWGQLIFERDNIKLNDETNGWDGTFNGKPQGPGVFVYLVDGICESDQEIFWKGDVTIIR